MISSSVTGKEDGHSMSKSARNSRFLQALVQFATTVGVEQCGARTKIAMVESTRMDSVSLKWVAQTPQSTTSSVLNQVSFPAVSEIARGILQVVVLN